MDNVDNPRLLPADPARFCAQSAFKKKNPSRLWQNKASLENCTPEKTGIWSNSSEYPWRRQTHADTGMRGSHSWKQAYFSLSHENTIFYSQKIANFIKESMVNTANTSMTLLPSQLTKTQKHEVSKDSSCSLAAQLKNPLLSSETTTKTSTKNTKAQRTKTLRNPMKKLRRFSQLAQHGLLSSPVINQMRSERLKDRNQRISPATTKPLCCECLKDWNRSGPSLKDNNGSDPINKVHPPALMLPTQWTLFLLQQLLESTIARPFLNSTTFQSPHCNIFKLHNSLFR